MAWINDRFKYNFFFPLNFFFFSRARLNGLGACYTHCRGEGHYEIKRRKICHGNRLHICLQLVSPPRETLRNYLSLFIYVCVIHLSSCKIHNGVKKIVALSFDARLYGGIFLNVSTYEKTRLPRPNKRML